jgi:putative heme-binding domain-containing protein
MIAPLLLLTAACALDAQHGNTTASNPHTRPEDRAEGERLYRDTCTGCHGKEGSGGSAAALNTGQFKYGATDTALFQSIASGIQGTPMPAFKLDARHVWQLVTYVRSMSQGRAHAQVKGDADKGAAVYAKSGCGGCHSVAGKGAFTAPDLTNVGQRLSLGDLQSSVTDPDASVHWDYWQVQATRGDGVQIRGRRMNEDSYTVQILDDKGRLLSFDKRGMEAYGMIRTSPMPSFKSKLSAADFVNLIAYLASLRGDR